MVGAVSSLGSVEKRTGFLIFSSRSREAVQPVYGHRVSAFLLLSNRQKNAKDTP